MIKETNPYVPLPDLKGSDPCICDSGRSYTGCCEPKLLRLNRAMGSLENWRDQEPYDAVFQTYSDLLWEEQYRDEDQGHSAQEYEEWDEWASYLWLEGVVLDGFTLEGVDPIPGLLRDRVERGERVPGGRDTLLELISSFEGVYEIVTPVTGDRPGLVELWHPPSEGNTIRVPRIFLPPDTEGSDMVIGRFVPLGGISFPTHRPLVIPILEDGSNFDAAFNILSPLLPADPENPGARVLVRRLLKSRGDVILRVALEALLPLESERSRSLLYTDLADGGEIQYMVSDTSAAESYLDQSPFFEVMGPVEHEQLEEEMSELLNGRPLPPAPEGPRWRLSLAPELRRRLRPAERELVEDLLWALAWGARPPFGANPFDHWSENPGLVAVVDHREGSLTARALYGPALELGRCLLEREVGPFLAKGGEEPFK